MRSTDDGNAEMTPALILASASPRRRELLGQLGLRFSVVPADVDETLHPTEHDWIAVARRLARLKARTVANQYPEATVLAADTIVVHRRQLLGKPRDADGARSMLRELRGRTHRVVTGVAAARGRAIHVGHAVTDVSMRRYSDGEIEEYIARGEPFDKAGAYAIQDERFRPVAWIDGCYCNVVGLPLGVAVRCLARFGVYLRRFEAPPQCHDCPLFHVAR